MICLSRRSHGPAARLATVLIATQITLALPSRSLTKLGGIRRLSRTDLAAPHGHLHHEAQELLPPASDRGSGRGGLPVVRPSDEGQIKTARPCDHSHSGATIASLIARLEQGGKWECIKGEKRGQEKKLTWWIFF
jgi:hypothetical protein